VNTDYRKLEQLMRALGTARRLRMLALLKKSKSMTVGEIAEGTRQTIQSASQNLAKLRAVGIIEQKRRGQFVTYRISLKQDEVMKIILRKL
jgi:DNA-binding transcriptional ArsR family regulator